MRLYDKVVDKIKTDIKSGLFPKGGKLPVEPELMSIYGVGRSTIREAVKTLVMSGTLTVKQGSGTFVNEDVYGEGIESRLRGAHFDEVNSVRRLLEKEIVRLATINRKNDDLVKMTGALEKRKAAIHEEKLKECEDADIEFHMAIARAGQNSVLSELYYSFTLMLREVFSARSPQGISHFAMNHYLHEELFKSIKAGKVKQSQSALDKILGIVTP